MLPLDWSVWLAQHHAALEWAAAAVAVLILISSLDDLFIDAWYWTLRIWRRLRIVNRDGYRPLTAEQLRERPEQPLAIMVPAWLEYDVIAAMVENMVTSLDYRNYQVFVGTYANDAATIREVERMGARYGQLQHVRLPHDGPTCKADCLNAIVTAIFAHEQAQGMEFAGVILHDSEDVLHPLELQLFNYLLPRKDMIQLPVTSLEREWWELVAGTYMDEFAEWHAKDLVVRESVSGLVPSAGVGTCFSRRALLALSADTGNKPFNTESLTEDYDVAARLGAGGFRSIFVRFPVLYRVKRKAWFGQRPERELTVKMPLCVREYFPNTFRTAYRQKARWVLGIGLQSWEQLGWRGSLATKYLLFRDRKGIVTSFVNILAYLLVLEFVVLYSLQALGMWNMQFPPLIAQGSWVSWVLGGNAIALLLRVTQRVYFVTKLYGWEHGLMAVPRMVVGNFINFAAVARAWKLFLGHLFFGNRVVWDKTMHHFPDAQLLARRHRRLGELLGAWQALGAGQLDAAMADQARTRLPLGHILVSHGWLDEETLAEALAYQSELPRARLDAATVEANATLLSLECCVQHRVLPLGRDARGALQLASASPLPAESLDDLRNVNAAAGGAPAVQLAIARESEIAAGLRLLAGADAGALPPMAPLLGDLLIQRGLVAREAFDNALRQYRPHRDGRIGDHLVAQGVVGREALAQALAAQRRPPAPPPAAPDVGNLVLA